MLLAWLGGLSVCETKVAREGERTRRVLHVCMPLSLFSTVDSWIEVLDEMGGNGDVSEDLHSRNNTVLASCPPRTVLPSPRAPRDFLDVLEEKNGLAILF